MEVTAVRGDITQQRVDAVVNAANSAMRGGGGVDGAIHRAGGPAVLEDCVRRFPDGLATGDAGWTTAGDLPARWVIHVVGPNRHAGQTDRGLLTSCYSRALAVIRLWEQAGLRFPSNLEVVAAGSGFRGAGRYTGSQEGLNKRFIIQVQPKIGSIGK